MPIHVFVFRVILDATRLASYITPNNTLVIEAPIQNPENECRLVQVKNDHQALAQFGQHRDPMFDYVGFLGSSDFQSRVVINGNNIRQLQITVSMKGFKPEEVKVSVKDNELMVQGEHEYKSGNRSERSSVIKTTLLPPGTQVDQLQSRLSDDGELQIAVPYSIWREEGIQPQNNLKSKEQSYAEADTIRELDTDMSTVFDRFYSMIVVE